MAAAILLIFGLIVLFTNLNRDTEKKTELLANKNVSFVKENAVNDATVSTNKVEEVLINANTENFYCGAKQCIQYEKGKTITS